MKYKIGDRVRIKSIDWYNENINNKGVIVCGSESFTHPMSHFCNEVVNIITIQDNCYRIFEDGGDWYWTDEMIECKVGQVEEETQSKEMLKENAKHYWKVINGNSKPKFKVGDKVTLLDLYPCVVTTVEWKGNSEYVGYVYTVRGTDFGKKVKEADLVFRDVEEETKLQLKFKTGDRVFNKVTRKWVNIIEFDIETSLYIVRYDDGIQGRSLESEMIEGLVEEENNHITETVVDTVRESNDRYRIVIDPRFDIEVDEGEYYAVRGKKEYPKTFLGCCDVLGIEDTISRGVKGYKSNLLDTLQKLLICRDAYWKIAGEEMGLGKPWKPNWDAKDRCFYTIHTFNGEIDCSGTAHRNAVLIFPTEEMRDAFYEYFKEEIEICKELL